MPGLKTVGLLVFLLFVVVVFGCGKKPEQSELVRVNDVSITIEDFREISERQSLQGKMRLLTEESRRDFLENYVIAREVLYQEAKKKGLDRKKDLMAKVEDFKRAIVIDALLEEELGGKDTVTDSEIEQYYRNNIERFTEPQEIKIRHIFVNTEAALSEVLEKLKRGEAFEKIASKYNVDHTKENGGNLGYLRRGQLAPAFSAFEEAAFSLKSKGDTSDVIRTPYGYHIIRLEDRKGMSSRPLEDVREKIRVYLRERKRQDAYIDFVKKAKARAKIVINEKLWSEEEKKGAGSEREPR